MVWSIILVSSELGRLVLGQFHCRCSILCAVQTFNIEETEKLGFSSKNQFLEPSWSEIESTGIYLSHPGLPVARDQSQEKSQFQTTSYLLGSSNLLAFQKNE